MKTTIAVAFPFCLCTSLYGADIVNISVNTNSLSGTTAYIDFQFNPAPTGSQAATVQIQNFTGATYLAGTQSDLGSVSGGPVPSTITITDSSAGVGINDDFEGITLGNSLRLQLTFTGPAVAMPDGMSSPSEFFLSMFSDPNGLDPILTSSPNGILGTISINPDTDLTVVRAVSSDLSFVPQPGSLALLGSCLLGLCAWGLCRRLRFSSNSAC